MFGVLYKLNGFQRINTIVPVSVSEDKYCCSGFCIDLLMKLAEEIGFDFKLYQVQDQKWGSKNEHGEWNGLIKDLVRLSGFVGLVLLVHQRFVNSRKGIYIERNVAFSM